jgi:hypothetical protein
MTTATKPATTPNCQDCGAEMRFDPGVFPGGAWYCPQRVGAIAPGGQFRCVPRPAGGPTPTSPPAGAAVHLDAARDALGEVQRAMAEAEHWAGVRARAIEAAIGEGMTASGVARVLGVSHQAVAQLLKRKS